MAEQLNLAESGATPGEGQGAPDAGQGGQAAASQKLSSGEGGDKATPSKLDILMEFVPEEDRQYIKSEDDYRQYQQYMREKTVAHNERERQEKIQKAQPAPSQSEDPTAALERILVEENKRDKQRVIDGEITPEQALARSQMRAADMARRMSQADMDTRDKQRNERQGKLLEFERTSSLPRSIRPQVAFLIDQLGWQPQEAERFGRDILESLKSDGYTEPPPREEHGGDDRGRRARSHVEPPSGGAGDALYGSSEAYERMQKAIAEMKPGQRFTDLPWDQYLKSRAK